MTPEKDSDVIRQQLSALISLYEHHLDLFWKWITLYATIVTALSVYIFNKELTPSHQAIVSDLDCGGVSWRCLRLLHHVALAKGT